MRSLLLILVTLVYTTVQAGEAPKYKPSSRSPEAIDITLNSYGASSIAPKAFGIGETAPDFTLPTSDSGIITLSKVASNGPVAIIFYRGHW